ncbi:MAG TPA: sialidase family protein [Limnochordia bacterium]|nr:sialidase family protein [Limnochordia bacterium]
MPKWELERLDTLFADGVSHVAFPRLTKWRERYWVAFRRGSGHRSPDGHICVMSSPDLVHWSEPQSVIATGADDRDPSLFAWRDRLFVTSASFEREWLDCENPWAGLKDERGVRTHVVWSDDGATWSQPVAVYEPDHFVWWPIVVGDRLYASTRLRRVRVQEGREVKRYAAKLATSEDGVDWHTVSVISEERLGSETALAALPDQSLLAFVRHDEKGALSHPELKLSRPPYTHWQKLYDFSYQTNGPGIATIGSQVLLAARAFFEDPGTPLVTPELRAKKRGLLVWSFDPQGERAEPRPELMLPHEPPPYPPNTTTAAGRGPDVGYPSLLDLGGGRLALCWYDGFKDGPTALRLAWLRQKEF